MPFVIPKGIIKAMHLFRKRISPVENLTFIAMMVAFDAILSLVSALVPFSAIFLMLLAPLTSAAVALFCRKRYIPLFLLAALGIGIAVTAWDFLNTIFYLFPALLTGTLYGLLWQWRVPSSLNIFVTSLLSLALFYASISLIKAMLGGVDMIEVLLTLIRRQGDPVARTIVPLFLYGYSLTQTALSHAFLVTELRHLDQEEPEEATWPKWYPLFATLLLVSSLVTAFFHAKTAYFLFGLGAYWAVASAFALAPKIHPVAIALLVFTVFGSVFLFAGVYRYMPSESGLLLLNAPLLLLTLASFLNPILIAHQKPKAPRYE